MSKRSNQRPERQAHRTNTKRYWKKIAEANEVTGIYSLENLNRMRLGSAPRRLALLRHKRSGLVVEMHVSVELHHVFGNKAEVPQEEQTLVELYPWQHDACDPDRKFGFEFIEWRGFQ